MNLQLVLPGLIWPSPNAVGLTSGLQLPALERLIGLAHVRAGPQTTLFHCLQRIFRLDKDCPVAALRRLGETDGADRVEDGAIWLCADPVHLHFAREHMLLSDASGLGITEPEATELSATINAFLAESEPALGRIEAATSQRWYLHLAEPTATRFHALDDVVGRPISHFMPEGDDARSWRRVANEIQVLLHAHPVNQAREADGRPAINSVWFWGAGQLPVDRSARITAPAPLVCADDPIVLGLARAAGVQTRACAELPSQDALVVLDRLHRAALQLDLDRWRDILAELERDWFGPLLAMLKSGRLRELQLVLPGDRLSLDIAVTRSDTWKFWRRPRTLDSFTQAPA
ncbi:hypothetical protein ACKVEX_03540 [Rhodocyclaceae bacterium SMB388]